jgi:glucose-1-phosphate cytidylyltransferase
MKVVILAGGFGTRISEESHLRPKPMIEIGGQPILWHIMKGYSHYGYNEFIICCGYKQHMIKQYFSEYYLHRCDVTFDFLDNNRVDIHSNVTEPWTVTLVDTGLNTMTGGRVKRVREYIGDETFMLTYGDGVSDIDIGKLVDYHSLHGKDATITTVQPGGKFGAIDMDSDGNIFSFVEKSKEDGGWINGGFMVLSPGIFDLIDNDDTIFERKPLEILAKSGRLVAYMHEGFWQCMDSQRDRQVLEEYWNSNKAPWKVW